MSGVDREAIDVLPPDQMAEWLRETADNTRERGNSTWTEQERRVAPHVAFRLEQAANMLEDLRARSMLLDKAKEIVDEVAYGLSRHTPGATSEAFYDIRLLLEDFENEKT